MISFNCPNCGKSFSIKDELAGRRSRCMACGMSFVVPGGPAPEALPLAVASAPARRQNEPDDDDRDTDDKDDRPSGGRGHRPGGGRFLHVLNHVFDFRFRYYLTPYIVRITWVLALVGASLYFISSTFITPFATADKRAPVEFDRRDLDPDHPKGRAPQKEAKEPSNLTKALGEIVDWVLTSGIRLVGLVVGLMYVRVLAEMTIVVFNISNDIKRLAGSPGAPQPVAEVDPSPDRRSPL